ncbi:MAG: hypothetical protein ACOH2M_27175 [Cypionkella sp.]
MTALAFLSLSRTHTGRNGVPQVPSNDQRVRAFRAFQPVQYANTVFTLSPGERYALEQCLDASPTTDTLEDL